MQYIHTQRTSTVCVRGAHHPLKPLIPLKGERPYSITVNRLQLIQQTVIPKVYVSDKNTFSDQQLRNFNASKTRIIPVAALHYTGLWREINRFQNYFCDVFFWQSHTVNSSADRELPHTNLENVNGASSENRCSLVDTCRITILSRGRLYWSEMKWQQHVLLTPILFITTGWGNSSTEVAAADLACSWWCQNRLKKKRTKSQLTEIKTAAYTAQRHPLHKTANCLISSTNTYKVIMTANVTNTEMKWTESTGSSIKIRSAHLPNHWSWIGPLWWAGPTGNQVAGNKHLIMCS